MARQLPPGVVLCLIVGGTIAPGAGRGSFDCEFHIEGQSLKARSEATVVCDRSRIGGSYPEVDPGVVADSRLGGPVSAAGLTASSGGCDIAGRRGPATGNVFGHFGSALRSHGSGALFHALSLDLGETVWWDTPEHGVRHDATRVRILSESLAGLDGRRVEPQTIAGVWKVLRADLLAAGRSPRLSPLRTRSRNSPVGPSRI